MRPTHSFPVTNRLKQLRESNGLAQYGLAVIARMSPTTILAIERYGLRPSNPVRQRIAQALGVSEADIWPAQEHAA
jgi:transcriptional regulator with XRE-family HTH domain